MNPLRRFQVSLGPPCSFEGAPGQRNRMQIAQIALAAALLAKSNAALGGGWAYTDNTACEGDDPTYVEDRNAALDLEALSYKEDGSEECEDISKVETIVVIGTRGGDGRGFSIGSEGAEVPTRSGTGRRFPMAAGAAVAAVKTVTTKRKKRMWSRAARGFASVPSTCSHHSRRFGFRTLFQNTTT